VGELASPDVVGSRSVFTWRRFVPRAKTSEPAWEPRDAVLVRSVLAYLVEHSPAPFSALWQAMNAPNEHPIRRAIDALISAGLVQVSEGTTTWTVRGTEISRACRVYRLTAKGRRAARLEKAPALPVAVPRPRDGRPPSAFRVGLRASVLAYVKAHGASSVSAIVVGGLDGKVSATTVRAVLRQLVDEGVLVTRRIHREGQGRAPRTGVRPASWWETVWDVANSTRSGQTAKPRGKKKAKAE
jgi:predicted ArsR family transcriptional regulator